MYILFGVKTDDIETARSWVETLIGSPAEARTNQYDGHYYSFGKLGEEWLKLSTAICSDEDGEYPAEPEFPGWTLLLSLNRTREDSALLRGLESVPHRFEKLRTEARS